MEVNKVDFALPLQPPIIILFEFVVLILQNAIFLYLVITYFWDTNEVH